MSDYRDIEKEAREKGILLDKCGLIDRYYDFGSYQDFCGMTPQEILDNMRKAGQGGGGGGEKKEKVKLSATLVSGETGWVVEVTSLDSNNIETPVPDTVEVTIVADGETQVIVMPAGTRKARSAKSVNKHAVLSMSVYPTSTDDTEYNTHIDNPNGEAEVSIITYKGDSEPIVVTSKKNVGETVTVQIDPTAYTEYNFVRWEIGEESGTTTKFSFEMPDTNSVEIKLYYEIKTFIVRFLNWDKSVIETETVKYNTTPSYSGEEPTKPEDEQFTYNFDGWDKPFAPITEDTDYTAVFTETLRTYQIQFLNYDGEVLQSGEIAYGTTPVYQGVTPTRESSPQYNYTFNGWTPEIVSVSGDATYTAEFSETLRQYTITWIISGESEEETLDYGTMPTHADPESAHTPEYDYTFSAWTPEIVPVEGNATYTAVFTETKNSYTIAFKNYDGTTLQSSEIEYGELPEYSGETPTKEETEQYIYTFSAWTPEITVVTGDAEYEAVFSETLRSYDITWLDEDSVLKRYYDWADNKYPWKEDLWNSVQNRAANWNDAIKDPRTGQPIIGEHGNWVYTSDGTVSGVPCERCWLGAFNAPEATFPWIALELPRPYEGIVEVVYKGETTVYPWGDEVKLFKNGFGCASIPNELGMAYLKSDINGDPADGNEDHRVAKDDLVITLIDASGNTVPATWHLINNEASWSAATYNVEHCILDVTSVPYGELPTHADPVKPATKEWTYTFDQWSPIPVAVTGPATYTASYNAEKNAYTVTWNISGESEEETLDFGVMPTHADPESAHTPEYDYTFSGWNPIIDRVTGDTEYTAVFTETKNSYPISVTNFDPAIIDVTISGETYVSTDVYPYGTEVVVRAEIKDEYKSQIHFVRFDDVWETTITVGETNVVSVPNIESDEYLVIWDNEGTELYREWLAYGLTPEYSGATPTKEATPQYTYAFSGWTPEIVPVTENATYSAVFSETVREYPISISGLSNDVQVTVNGAPYSAETEYAYGTTVRIEAEIVNKPEYHFVDSGDTWETEITVTDVNVVVLPAIVKDTYSVTWYNDTPYRRYYNWNDTHTYDGTYLTKEDLWYDNGVTARAADLQDIVRDEHGDPILDEYGKYVYNEYCTRCWKGAFYAPGATFPWCVVELDSPFDGTIKFAYKEGTPDEKIVYPWGEHVVARPNGYGCASIPDELGLPELKVNFSGEPHFNKSDLHVTLIDEYGVESEANWSLVEDEASWIEAYGALYQEEVAYGVTPSYSGSTLTKEATQEYTYSFSGWTPEVVPVVKDAEYTAVFAKTVKQYNVSLSGDPLLVTLSGSGSYNYGTVATISATPASGYTFSQWSDGVTASTRQIVVVGNITLTATVREETSGLAYWGKVPTSDFDALGNTFSSTDLTSLLIAPYEGGDQGSEVGYGDEAKTAITYEYVITSADEEAQSAYEEDYEPEPLYDYVMGNSMYYIYAIPSEYLSNATLSITDDYSSSWPTSSANTYVIDGVNYTIYKFIAAHTPIGDDPDYSIPETYFSVLDSPEYTEGYSYKRPTNFVLNKNV